MTEKTVEHECMRCGKVYWGTTSPHFCPHCNSSMTRAVDTETERVNTLEFELDKLITLHLRCIGENNRLRAEIAELRDGHPGSEPPTCAETRSSGMKLVLTKHIGYRLANYWPEYSAWLESWTMMQLEEVVTWWELGGTR